MVLHYDIDEVRPYINWIYFDHAWSMSGKSEPDKAGLYADANELFLSTPLSFENFTTDLVVFDKKGKLLARYAGLKDDPADWAVTKHYLVQASATGDVLIYDRSNGKKVFNARVNQFVPRYLYSMGGDMILACDNVTKFYILKLE